MGAYEREKAQDDWDWQADKMHSLAQALPREIVHSRKDASHARTTQEALDVVRMHLQSMSHLARDYHDNVGNAELILSLGDIVSRTGLALTELKTAETSKQGLLEIARTWTALSTEWTGFAAAWQDDLTQALSSHHGESSLADRVGALEHALQSFNVRRIANAQADVERIVAVIEGLAEKARKAAFELTLSKYSDAFRVQAKKHQTLADTWLSRTILLATATFVVGLLLIFVPIIFPLPSTPAFLIEFALVRIFLVGILLAAAVFSAQNYRSHSHNVVVNEHRQNALNSFEAFYEKATREDTKNAVLLEATKAIYVPLDTGYGGGIDGSKTTTSVMEFVRTASGKD